uniref:Receptor-like protein kinase n=1 Tax=Catharanthus roseus TaxID=4058 RepID=Q96387_CATRO|nr:receptor-like protein kinase [Catharanthus roseus]
MRILIQEMLIRTLFFFYLIISSLEFTPENNYLINCGSFNDTSIDDRIFLADNLNSTVLSTPETIFANSSNSNSVLDLYKSARIFNGSSQYNFSINKKGWHWIRLHFFPFPISNEKFNLSSAKFSVFAQNFTLLKDFQPLNNVPVVKEFSLNVNSNNLLLKFTPSRNSLAFLNGLEVISLPDELIPFSIGNQNLEKNALETVVRVNMGNVTVSSKDDPLGRIWLSDYNYLSNVNLVVFVSNIHLVNYTKGEEKVSENIGPSSVYGTGTKLHSVFDPNTQINATWLFNVDSGFGYFIRFHFCNLLNPIPNNNFFFNVFLNSEFVVKDLNLSTSGAPMYKDVVVVTNVVPQIRISVGPSNVRNSYPDGILNGLEIMKISTSDGSLAAVDADFPSSSSSSKLKVWIIVSLAIGISLILVVFTVVFLFRRRKRHVMIHSTPDHLTEEDDSNSSIFSRSKIGYRFPLAVVQEATDNFSENRVIGIGGFGKVYKGVFKDGTKVAVKRGISCSSSKQGLSEFRTEVELLSQFRHRHLVSLIGYCDEKNEMIIIYEFMENGTLRDHLYGSDKPKLNWRKRVEICIGSAKGLHYLHTGTMKRIIHRDVKSANILLDENLMAKVADFGVSKTGPDHFDQTHVSTAVKGSFGYLDPEYLTMQKLTEKSDVYSFGVVMLEILTGRPVIDPSKPREMVNLVEWAMKCSRKGEEIVDSDIVNEVRPESLIKFQETAEKCLAERGVDRPTMGDVLWNLECALQLQGKQKENEQPEEMRDVSATEISLGSMADLAAVSMSKVFSELVKAQGTRSEFGSAP